MTNLTKLLETIDSMSKAADKPSGPKFPGYWKGSDSASKAKDKMVGSAEESILPEISCQSKEGSVERRLNENWKQYKALSEQPVTINNQTFNRADLEKELDNPEGLLMQMPNEPQYVQTSSGPLRSGDGQLVRTGTDKPGKVVRVKPDSSEMDKLLDIPTQKPSEPAKPVVAPLTPRGKVTSTEIEPGIQNGDSSLATARPVLPKPEKTSAPDYVKLAKERGLKVSRNNVINAIASANKIADPSKIKVGQVITLNDASGRTYLYRIGPGDNLWNISRGVLKGKRV